MVYTFMRKFYSAVEPGTAEAEFRAARRCTTDQFVYYFTSIHICERRDFVHTRVDAEAASFSVVFHQWVFHRHRDSL